MCIHGDKVSYLTAEVARRSSWFNGHKLHARVVVTPDIPVSVLLETDIYDLTPSNPVMVTTRTQARRECNTIARPVIIPEEDMSEPCQTIDK